MATETQKCNKCDLLKEYQEFWRKGRGKLLYKTCNTCINTPMIRCPHCKANKLPIHFEKNGRILKMCAG